MQKQRDENGFKNVDLDSRAGLPTEKALGINWNIENDYGKYINPRFFVVIKENYLYSQTG